MELNAVGEMIESAWRGIPERFVNATLDQYIIMPNHVHGIILLNGQRMDVAGREHGGARGAKEYRAGERDAGEGTAGEGTAGERDAGEHKVRPYGTAAGTLGRIIQAFKSITTDEYIRRVKEDSWPLFEVVRLWHRSFHEHIIRDEIDLANHQQYIRDNPPNWERDKHNPDFSDEQSDGIE